MMRSSVLAITAMLVCTAMAVPSPSAEESEDLRPKRSHNPNEYDEYHSIQCPTGEGLCGLESEHNNGREDRIFNYKCCRVTAAVNVAECRWTDYTTEFDTPISFMCPKNQYLGGTASRHDNGREDRIFKYQCCRGHFQSKGCSMTNYLNTWDQRIIYSSGSDTFAGTASFHDNGTEDRRYKFIVCKFE